MSLRIGALGVHLPDPQEIESPRPRPGAPEELRLAPLTPMPPRRATPAMLELPDARTMALLDASIARLADLTAGVLAPEVADGSARSARTGATGAGEPIVRPALSPELVAALGARIDAVRGLAIGVREVIGDRDAVRDARLGWVLG